MTLRVLVLGTFDPRIERNRVLLSLLARAGCAVRVRQVHLWGERGDSVVRRGRLRLVLRALRAYPAVAWHLVTSPRPDVILVGYPGHLDMLVLGPLARLRRIPIVFDVFISLYDTIVSDRRLAAPDSFLGRASALVDRFACRFADVVLADTPPHAEFFAAHARLPPARLRVLWVGAHDEVFAPVPGAEVDPGLVLFYGTYIPLHGVDTIVRAAKLLERDGVRVRLIGDGQERPHIERLARELAVTNVEWSDPVPVEALAAEIARAEICLGIFGTSEKAARVVPNKVYQCLAVGRPVVTAATPAMACAFDGEVEIVPAGDATALAERIRSLRSDPVRLAAVARAGHERYWRDYAGEALAPLLRAHLTDAATGTAPEAPGAGSGARTRGPVP